MAMLQKRDEIPVPEGRTMAQPQDTHTVLGKEAQFEGKLSFEGSVRIDGQFKGEVHTNDSLVVGQGAHVEAEMFVGTVVINGEVVGNITAKTAVEIRAPGRLRGNIMTPSLFIDKGVLFDGTCKMDTSAPAELRPKSGAGLSQPPPLKPPTLTNP